MTELGQSILQDVYRVPQRKIDLIPHGIPNVSFVASDHYKAQFGVGWKRVLLTFGLLSPNKGIEYMLNALPDIVGEFPDVVYILLGATHRNEARTRGEAYRVGLEAIVQRNKLEDNVIFDNRFVELKELTEFLGAADLYITPYLDEAQISSGTLAYGFGAGKAVISTPYWHAAELLNNQRGVLVPFGDSTAIAREVTALLRDEPRRKTMSANAYRLGREMVWSRTAGLYMRSFELARRQWPAARGPGVAQQRHAPGRHETPEVNLSHLYYMTDSTGILQHASLTAPNLSEGYCTDDNARALFLAALLNQMGDAPRRIRALARMYTPFLQDAFEPSTRRFHNFLGIDRRWLDKQGSEDSHGRALWALGTVVGRAPDWSDRGIAGELFLDALPALTDFTSPRAWAFGLIGIHEYLRRFNGGRLASEVGQELTGRLMTIFEKVAQPKWLWFEEKLSYDNAKLAHALIASGRATRQQNVSDRGIDALRWLVTVQTSRHGWFRPIGSNGFYKRSGIRADFDQQPIEAHSTVSAWLEAYRTTADPWWHEEAQRAFEWFLGWNDLGEELYCPQTGGCRDALQADRGNENQGAESTLAFLMSLAEMRLMQNSAAAFQQAGRATPGIR